MRFRFQVEQYLKAALLDTTGKLTVGNQGPQWNGKVKLAGLSYSNSAEWGVVVFSHTHALGVDLEKTKRVLKKNYLQLAKRFFHSSEYEQLRAESIFDGPTQFLKLWMMKEAYSKMKRKNLIEFININVSDQASFSPLVKTREDYRAIIAIDSEVIG